MFSVNDIVVLVNLDYFASLPTFVVSSYNLNFIILSDGQGWKLVLMSQVFGERGHDLPVNVAKGTEMPFTFLLQSQVTKGLNFVLVAGTPAMSTKGETCNKDQNKDQNLQKTKTSVENMNFRDRRHRY